MSLKQILNELHAALPFSRMPKSVSDFPPEDMFRFRYEYDSLPCRALPRFIARWQADTCALLWETGVVLKNEALDARAVVWSDVRDRKIMIDVAGHDRRQYFCRIHAEFRKIHDTFQKLDVTEKVSLPGEPDYDVDYEDLLFHEEKDRATILVGGLRREYSVQRLLGGTERGEDRQFDRLSKQTKGLLRKSRTEPLMEPSAAEFDVFLSHNSKDKEDVRTLNAALRDRGVRTWLDEEQLQFGDSISDELQSILDNCGSALVCIGQHGLGPWHDEEQKVLTSRRVNARKSGQKFRIIPVYLPTAPRAAEMPAFLRDQLAVELRGGTSDEILDKLKTAVMSKR